MFNRDEVRQAIEEALKDTVVPVDVRALSQKLSRAILSKVGMDPIEDHLDIKVSEDLTISVTAKTALGARIVADMRGDLK